MAYYWFKTFHIVGFVSWFAGLFYLARLFVYHVEADLEPEPKRTWFRQQYTVMEKRLYGIITTPAMVLTVAMAIGLVSTEPEVLKQPWLHVKMGLVGLLIAYHFYCRRIISRLEADDNPLSAQQFRWLNELPTFFLVLVVMLATFKNSFPTDGATYVIAAMVVSFAASIQLYARKRRLDRERAAAAQAPDLAAPAPSPEPQS